MSKNIKLQKIEKTASGAIRNGFDNHKFTTSKFDDLFVFDNSTIAEKIEDKVREITKPGAVKRCFICSACKRPRTLRKMSAFVNTCREWLNEAKTKKTKGRISQSNFIARITNNFSKLLRAEVSK